MPYNICKECFCYMWDHPTEPGLIKCACGYTKKHRKYINMISMQELNKNGYPVTPEIEANLKILFDRINKVRTAYGQPMIVTSGLRSQAKQDELIAQGKSNAPKSKHLTGQAVDISDPDNKLKDWVKENMKLMEEIGFWFEDFRHTPNWVHFQTVSPTSGNRVFIP